MPETNENSLENVQFQCAYVSKQVHFDAIHVKISLLQTFTLSKHVKMYNYVPY